ncbi:putative thioredoxin-like protein [Rosa chinensis]|uniref:Putative thioredoxin-like protein n=1 Tax=Rosa chinensis TaxID=74649 RepID=A0A2P6PFE0_ROSCH|nr:putative thioredoxin-like protein [Rosa chinensis]
MSVDVIPWLCAEAKAFKLSNVGLVLHDWKTNKNGCKARIAAKYSGVNLELVKNFEMGMSNKTANFLKLTPYWEGSFVRNTCWSCFREQCHFTSLKANNTLFGSSLFEHPLWSNG